MNRIAQRLIHKKSMRRGFEEILQLAATAAKWDLDTEKDYEAFREFSREAGIKEEQPAYNLNAYQANGESGLKALTYKEPGSSTTSPSAMSATQPLF